MIITLVGLLVLKGEEAIEEALRVNNNNISVLY